MLMVLLAVILGLLPGFAWLVFYMTEDPRPEPKRLILFTFLAGMVFGFLAILVEQLWNAGAGGLGIERLSLLSLLGLALIEECTKFAAGWVSINRTPEMRDPIDPMVYMIVAALGFATLENISLVLHLTTVPTGFTLTALQTLSFRFVGATLLHSLTSGLVGYQWSLGLAKKRVGRCLAVGFILAICAHAAFNYLVLNAVTLAYPILFLLLVGLFVLNDFEKLREKEQAIGHRP
jgi:RsiW-degrading membrane proteinase PrsW (M82 family)